MQGAVNTSAVQFARSDLAETVAATLAETGLEASGSDYPPHAGCCRHSLPLDFTLGNLFAQFHHVLRIAASLPPCNLHPLTGSLTGFHGVPSTARPREDGNAPGDRPVRLVAIRLLHGGSW